MVTHLNGYDWCTLVHLSNIAAVQSTPAPQALPDVRVPDIDRCVQTGVAEKTFSAAACVASVGDRIFHRAVYGSLALPPPIRKPGFDTLFDLASLTKPLATGLAALKLASQGRLDLNASVNKTIPELRDARFAGISIDMLLDHSSGLPAMRKFHEGVLAHDAKPGADKVAGTRKAVPLVREMLAAVSLEAEPGTKAVYSDIGFMALAWIIEGVVGKPFDVYLSQEIYRDLGLADDLLFVRLDDDRQRARLRSRSFAAGEDCPWRKKLLVGEVHDANAWVMGGVAGHAGLFGTVDAVWRLVRTLWQCFRGESHVFLNGTVRRFWTRSKRIASTTRTLAWDTPSAHGSMAGKRFSLSSVGHLGHTGGSIWIDLASDTLGVLLTNAHHPTRAGKDEALAKLRPRLYDLMAKHGEALPPDPKRPQGAAAFYAGPVVGASIPLHNPLKGPRQ
ncbi:MAG: serine hydrolase [Deltaproteobacteria bacterium]|nr:serine hydrolase [Deltaproteobacteria bacterium]